MTFRTFLFTLITMVLFHYLPQVMPIYVFIILVVLITATVVLGDIMLHANIKSLTDGKMSQLKDSNEQLYNAVENFKIEVCDGQKKPEFDSFVLDGQSGHSNCVVTGLKFCGQKRKLIVYE